MTSEDGVCPIDGTACRTLEIKTPATLTLAGWPYGNLWIVTLAVVFWSRSWPLLDSAPNKALIFGDLWAYIFAWSAIGLGVCAVFNRWDGRAQLAALTIGMGVCGMRAGVVLEHIGWDDRQVAAPDIGLAAASLLILVWVPPQRWHWGASWSRT